MDSNHRFALCRSDAFAARRRDRVLRKWTHWDSHPDFQRAELVSSCWTMSPNRSIAEAVRLELTSGQAATCFRDRLLIRPDHFRLRCLQSSGDWNRTNGILVQSQASLPTATTPECVVVADTRASVEVRGEGLEPPSPGSKPGSLPLADPRSCSVQSRVPCGNRTRLASLEGWRLCRSAKGT